MTELRTCRRCGAAIPAHAPRRLPRLPAARRHGVRRARLRAGIIRPIGPGSVGPGSTSLDRADGISPAAGWARYLDDPVAGLRAMPRVLLRDPADGPETPVPVAAPDGGEPPSPLRPLSILRRDRPRRHGGHPQGARHRAEPRPGHQGPARPAPRQRRAGPAVRRGGADRRPTSAPRHRADLRAWRARRSPPVLRHEAGQGPDPGRTAG